MNNSQEQLETIKFEIGTIFNVNGKKYSVVERTRDCVWIEEEGKVEHIYEGRPPVPCRAIRHDIRVETRSGWKNGSQNFEYTDRERGCGNICFDARDFQSEEESYRDFFKRQLEVAEEVQKSNPQPMYPQMNWINADDDIYR